MPREIKGFTFLARYRNAWEIYKTEKTYRGLYAEEDLKILNMVNQWGRPYTDFYLRDGAEPIREITAMFGSAMTFKDIETGELSGDRIRIRVSKQ